MFIFVFVFCWAGGISPTAHHIIFSWPQFVRKRMPCQSSLHRKLQYEHFRLPECQSEYMQCVLKEWWKSNIQSTSCISLYILFEIEHTPESPPQILSFTCCLASVDTLFHYSFFFWCKMARCTKWFCQSHVLLKTH